VTRADMVTNSELYLLIDAGIVSAKADELKRAEMRVSTQANFRQLK